MDKYKVKLNPKAYRDLNEIFDYISQNLQSPENAKRQTNRLWKALKSLDTFPQSHQKRITGTYAEKSYHQLLTDNYITIFKIEESQKIVKIITIQYEKRNF